MEKKWFIGIDISKKTLDVVLYNSQKKHSDETNYRKFSNDEEGYKELLSWCRSKYISCSQLVVGMENTGVYGFDLRLFLENKKIDYCAFMPLDLKHSMGLIRGKNDKVDAERIAYYTYLHREELSYSASPSFKAICLYSDVCDENLADRLLHSQATTHLFFF